MGVLRKGGGAPGKGGEGLTFFSLKSRKGGGGYPRAKPGRSGSLASAIKNRHFGGERSWILAVKARKCGKFWVFAACVPNPGKQSIWRQHPPKC